MHILADQDVWQKTVDVLRNAGHDVVTARALDLASADDRTLLERAAAEGRILLTRDKDFGTLVFLGGASNKRRGFSTHYPILCTRGARYFC